jgi:hypothetical protein
MKPVAVAQSPKVELAENTPIKKMQEEEREKFSDSMSSLPQVSKQSLSKSLQESAHE